ncbi:MAG: DUF58 domain-containing protein [Leptolyngbyaceae cyanobacterium SL_1_1]|nr:DUF58 domain-containing protein [Leptolyngbyaceae cyanobacterium RM1_1_2]NJO10177.1 DUF58 domain-containing protein [Leptolyngbyaceae cyanobacterium SL_1_1]
MQIFQKANGWLTAHWVAPAYSGWVLLGLTLFFFGAATNTLAGWLYVISGVMLALLAIAAVLPPRLLQGLQVQRQPLRPVSVGDRLRIDLRLTNNTAQSKGMLQICDPLPMALGGSQTQAIALLKPRDTYHWRFDCLAQRRGLYNWQAVQLRTAAPFGLFWCYRDRLAKANAVVYPTVLPLSQCLLIDQQLGQAQQRWVGDRRYQSATEGITRALRPYRWGDPIRLIHWRTSARYGELRVRELEHFTSAQAITICLDSASSWQAEHFEQAVTAAASLYGYGLQRGAAVAVWTARTGILHQETAILTALAAVEIAEPTVHTLPKHALIWLSETAIAQPLPLGSYRIGWQSPEADQFAGSQNHAYPLLQIDPALPLAPQLQTGVNFSR